MIESVLKQHVHSGKLRQPKWPSEQIAGPTCMHSVVASSKLTPCLLRKMRGVNQCSPRMQAMFHEGETSRV